MRIAIILALLGLAGCDTNAPNKRAQTERVKTAETLEATPVAATSAPARFSQAEIDAHTEACYGEWTSVTRSVDGTAFNLDVWSHPREGAKYDIAFSDMDSSTGGWSASDGGELKLVLEATSEEERFSMMDCAGNSAVIAFEDGRAFEMKRGTKEFIENDVGGEVE